MYELRVRSLSLTPKPISRNTDCDYSSAYVTLFADGDKPLVGHGMTFTIGRGNDIVSPQIHLRSARH